MPNCRHYNGWRKRLQPRMLILFLIADSPPDKNALSLTAPLLRRHLHLTGILEKYFKLCQRSDQRHRKHHRKRRLRPGNADAVRQIQADRKRTCILRSSPDTASAPHSGKSPSSLSFLPCAAWLPSASEQQYHNKQQLIKYALPGIPHK